MGYVGRGLLVGVGVVVMAVLGGVAGLQGADDCVVIADFAKSKVGEFPAGWKPRKDAGREVYRVREEGGRRFLRAGAREVGIQAALQHEWDLTTHPVLAWSWRPIEFPRGSDERKDKTNDSALAVYAVFPHSSVTVKSVKYVWSERVPEGTHLSISRGLTQVRIVRSGGAKGEGWVEQRVNVRDDYQRFFKETETPKPAGIAVLTDADDTKSSAQGDYANFRACRG